MSRVQLALNVENLEAAVEFYSRLFGCAPAKVRPGYANFAIADPPLKLVLIEGGAPGTLNHLGIEVPSSDGVASEIDRLRGEGLPMTVEESVECCFALQHKAWVAAPDGEPWEVYTVLADVGTGVTNGSTAAMAATAACCDDVNVSLGAKPR